MNLIIENNRNTKTTGIGMKNLIMIGLCPSHCLQDLVETWQPEPARPYWRLIS